jgi:hypothetical protein
MVTSMFDSKSKFVIKVHNKIRIDDMNCYHVERKFIKCMKNTGDDLKKCVDLLHIWNTCMDKYYNGIK